MKPKITTHSSVAIGILAICLGVYFFLKAIPDKDGNGEVNTSIPSPLSREMADRISDLGSDDDVRTEIDLRPTLDTVTEKRATQTVESKVSTVRPKTSKRSARKEPKPEEKAETMVTAADSTAEKPAQQEKAEIRSTESYAEGEMFEVRTVGEQTIEDGGYISIITVDPIPDPRMEIPSGTRIRMRCHVDERRIHLTSVAAHVGKRSLQIAMQACDADGVEGISLPGSLLDEGGKTASEATAAAIAEAGNSLTSSLSRVAAAATRQIAEGVERGVRESRSRRGIRLARNERLYLKYMER